MAGFKCALYNCNLLSSLDDLPEEEIERLWIEEALRRAAEFDEAAAYYAIERASLSEAFISAVENAVTQAQRYPEATPVIRGRVRNSAKPG